MIVETLKPLIRVAQIVNMDWAKYEQLKSKTKKTDEEWALFLKLDVERGEFESLEDAAKHLQKGTQGMCIEDPERDHCEMTVSITENLQLQGECNLKNGDNLRAAVKVRKEVDGRPRWEEVEELSMVAEYLIVPLTTNFKNSIN